MATASSESVTQVTNKRTMSGWVAVCTPGHEVQCATAASEECHCACGGEHHGKQRELFMAVSENGTYGEARRAVRRALSPQLSLAGIE